MASPPIKLPEPLDSQLTAIAKERRSTRAKVLRDALAAYSEHAAKPRSQDTSVPMSLADACLVRMTELDGRTSVLTMDRDFRIYRRNGRQAVPVVMPE